MATFLYVVNSQKRRRKKKFTAGVKFINALPAGRFTGKIALKTSKMLRLEKIICCFFYKAVDLNAPRGVPHPQLRSYGGIRRPMQIETFLGLWNCIESLKESKNPPNYCKFSICDKAKVYTVTTCRLQRRRAYAVLITA
jgi:hypothetical protein